MWTMIAYWQNFLEQHFCVDVDDDDDVNCCFSQRRFSDTGASADNLTKVQGELDELRGIMVKNIGKNLTQSKQESWVKFEQIKISSGELGAKLLEFKSSLLISTEN